MKLLLDTHILLWTIFEPEKLSQLHTTAIKDPHNIVCVSIASLWEIAIKKNIGRLIIPDSFFDTIYKESGFSLLLLQLQHIITYQTLPLHHRDPFDRLLIAQSMVEQLTLVTSDDHLAKYNVSLLK